MEGLTIWGFDLILSGVAGSTNPRLGFPHRAGRYRPERSPVSSPVCWSRHMDIFMNPVLPGCRWLHEHHAATSKTEFAMKIGGLDLAHDVY